MDSLITAAARALALGDPLAALKCVALRDDAPALALRGTAMAQMGELGRARDLLRLAARAFGTREPKARARCQLAEAEIALVLRDLGRPLDILATARTTLASHGDFRNAAHAAYLDARRLFLIGQLDGAEALLAQITFADLPIASRAGTWLVAAGIAMRRVKSRNAEAALRQARAAAEDAMIPSLVNEVAQAERVYAEPAARLIERAGSRLLSLADVESLQTSGTVLIDACRNGVRCGGSLVSLASRPVLFSLARSLAEGWPDDMPRERLIAGAFGARHFDESHRVRLRVEISRLRDSVKELVDIQATERGFVLSPLGGGTVAVLAPPVEDPNAPILALLADGEAWSSSALALALGVSARTVQRALDTLAAEGKACAIGRGRACRWIAPRVPGFPTHLLLPAPETNG